MTGGGVKVPKASAEEKALQQKQADLLDLQTQIISQQRQQQQVLLPFFAEQEGFDVETDDNGNITKISKKPDELQDMRNSLEKQYLQREQDALAGNLPVDPALERDIKQQEETLRQRLQDQFGAGYETSSPAIEALQKQEESGNLARDQARRGDLTLAQQLGLNQGQQTDYTRRTSQDFLRQIASGDQYTAAGAAGQVASGYGAAVQPYFAQRQLVAQARAQNQSTLGSIIGAGIGAAGQIGAAAFKFSDERLKSDAIQISEMPSGIPIYEYTYDGERRIGVFASDVKKVFPMAVGERFGYETVNYEAL